MLPLKRGWVTSKSEKKEKCAVHEERKCLGKGPILLQRISLTAHANVLGSQKQETE